MKKQQQIKGFYEDVIKAEKLPFFPLVFCRASKGGACVEFDPYSKKPINVQIDINRCADPEYAILHEVAHLKLLLSKKDPAFKHNAAFRKIESEMVDKYMYSSISFKHFM